MALLEVKVMAVMLLKHFHLEAVEGHVVEPKITITLNTKNGVKVNAINR
jgi:cytochrome P450